MKATRSLLDDIKAKQLQWYGHVLRMEEGRLPKEVMKWRPPGRRKRGRPKLTWAEDIRGLIGEKGLMEENWNDRSNVEEEDTIIVNGSRKMGKHCTTITVNKCVFCLVYELRYFV
jgi:hypothetical protein